MSSQQTKTKRRPLSRGQRTHVRRMKQEAHLTGTTYRPPFGATRAPVMPKKETKTPKDE